MPESEAQDPSPPRAPRGVGEAAAEALASFLDYIHLRLELVRLEAREALVTARQRAALFCVALAFGIIAYVGALVGGVGWLASSVEWPWYFVVLAVGGGHLLLALILIGLGRRSRTPLFQDTLQELEKDRQWLSRRKTQD